MRIVLMIFFLLFTVMVRTDASADLIFLREGGKYYWYEDNVRQGVPGDPKNIIDPLFGLERGREIYDPASNAWYWLDASLNGARAEAKEVWMPYIYQNEETPSEGKWVRYDEKGRMVKGWYLNAEGRYYYDPVTGGMVKGTAWIVDRAYHFDETTGILDDSQGEYDDLLNNRFVYLNHLDSLTNSTLNAYLADVNDRLKKNGQSLAANSDMDKVKAVLTGMYVFEYTEDGDTILDLARSGQGSSLAFSSFVHSVLTKMGVRDIFFSKALPVFDDGTYYPQGYRTVIARIGENWYELDGVLAAYESAHYGIALPQAISDDYAMYLLGR
ncbi:MAG: hypothetical protein IKD69_05275 [Solobacterium sp.]|nr:hypothetical protein [Solobacterium sp.]